MQSSPSPNSPRSNWKSSFLKFYHFSLTRWSSNVSESGVASASSMGPLEPSTVDVESVDIELSERKNPEEVRVKSDRSPYLEYRLSPATSIVTSPADDGWLVPDGSPYNADPVPARLS